MKLILGHFKRAMCITANVNKYKTKFLDKCYSDSYLLAMMCKGVNNVFVKTHKKHLTKVPSTPNLDNIKNDVL